MSSNLSDYERLRLKNIEESRRILKELGLSNPIQNNLKRKSEFAPPGKVKKARLSSQTSKEVVAPTPRRRSGRLKGLAPNEAQEWQFEDYDEKEENYVPRVTTSRPNIFGSIPGIEVGHIWLTRLECCHDGIHRPTVAGIHGSETEGCYSIALSGGYEDNVDLGSSFTYTGEGGRDLKGTKTNPKNLRTAPQSKDQILSRGNLALSLNIKNRKPVRVVRGYKLNSPYSPDEGYRFDGLYYVEKMWFTTGVSKFGVYKFALRRCEDQAPPPWKSEEDGDSGYSSTHISSEAESEGDTLLGNEVTSAEMVKKS